MPKLERLLLISIPEEDIKKEFRWRYQRWGEDAVKTYLVKNSHLVDEGLTLLGVGELFCYREPKPKTHYFSDIVFRRDDVYYVVEVKDSKDYAWRQLLDEVASFECDMRQHKEPCQEIIPVLVIVDPGIEKVERYWREMEKEEDFKKQLQELGFQFK